MVAGSIFGIRFWWHLIRSKQLSSSSVCHVQYLPGSLFLIIQSIIYRFTCTQLNGFKHRDVTLTIQFRHSVKEIQVMLFNTNNSIQHSRICFPTVKWFQVLLCITNNSIKVQSLVYAHLNGQTILFLTIRFSIRDLFAVSLKVKQL